MIKIEGDNEFSQKVCFKDEHKSKVWSIMSNNLSDLFKKYLKSGEDDNNFKLALNSKYNVSNFTTSDFAEDSKSLARLANTAIKEYEKDRSDYVDNLDFDTLEEFEEDSSYKNFKKWFLNNIPIVRKTFNKIDEYKKAYNLNDAKDLFRVVKNLVIRVDELSNCHYIDIDYSDKGIFDLDDTKYYVDWSVIGGGIRSRLLYKLNPSIFPNRSREAILSLWYLSDKQKDFKMEGGSEFLIFDFKHNQTIVQQNYYYPYSLFAYYASKISDYLEKKYALYKVILNSKTNFENYRFVFVNHFLNFVVDNCKTDEDKKMLNGYDF